MWGVGEERMLLFSVGRPAFQLRQTRRANLCTFSSDSMSLMRLGSHTIVQYSRWGQMNDLYNWRSVAEGRVSEFRELSIKETNESPGFIAQVGHMGRPR